MVVQFLKGLSHEIFGPVFRAVWMSQGLSVNRLWFFNFKDASLILDNYFKFECVSGQTLSKILRISEKDWQLSLQFSNFFVEFWLADLQKRCFGCKYFSENRRISENDWQLSPQFSEKDWQLSPQLLILLGDS